MQETPAPEPGLFGKPMPAVTVPVVTVPAVAVSGAKHGEAVAVAFASALVLLLPSWNWNCRCDATEDAWVDKEEMACHT